MTTEILCEVRDPILSLEIKNDQLLVEGLETIQAVNLSDYRQVGDPQVRSLDDLKCDEWVVRSDYKEKCDFVLGKDKTYQLPHPKYVYRDSISFRRALSTHQYVIGYLNKCAIYNLWNMKPDATPNRTLELPEESFILATHLHKGTLFVSTIDGKIWICS
ncbi:MAG: hypothetical protein JSS12_06735 [Verrucomicrobia bacterium]|nr:hypothetical protein [Verrucomicrobiota bacterium]